MDLYKEIGFNKNTNYKITKLMRCDTLKIQTWVEGQRAKRE